MSEICTKNDKLPLGVNYLYWYSCICASLIFTLIPICLFNIYFPHLIIKGQALVIPNVMRKTADTKETDAHVSKT